jgi:protein involved in polysaccharide export with SLBB domain
MVTDILNPMAAKPPVQVIAASLASLLLFGNGCAIWSASSAATRTSEQLAVGDRLLVSIKDTDGILPATTFTPLLDADGRIRLPWVSPIDVAGGDIALASQSIARAYREANYEGNREVTVSRIEITSAPATPRGKIRHGDRLKARIFDLDSPGQIAVIEAEVDSLGTFVVPHIGPIFLAGLSEWEAARTISERLKIASILNDAVVEVIRE